MTLGIHFTNRQWEAPPDEHYRLLALCRPAMVKTCVHNQCGYDQYAVHRRLRAEHPTALIVARLMGNGFDAGDYWRYIDGLQGVVDAWEIGNEPNHVDEWAGGAESWLRWFNATLSQYREWFPSASFVFPGMAVNGTQWTWYAACKAAIERCDYVAVHAYWQEHNLFHPDFGGCPATLRQYTTKPQIVTEIGDSTPGRSSVDKARLYVEWAQGLPAYVVGSAVYILGGTPDWAEFELDEAACRILGAREVQPMAPSFALRRPLPDGVGRVSQNFGADPKKYAKWGLAGHEGLDYGRRVGAPSLEGTPVLACHAGKCIVNTHGNYGNHVRLVGDGMETVYAHLSSIDVAMDQHVEVGQQIGRVGNTGLSTGAHLHLGWKVGGVKNPAYKNWLDPVLGRRLNGDA